MLPSAMPNRCRWIFFLPPLLVVLVGLMLIATIALWRGSQRLLIGWFYYTILTLSGLSGVVGLFNLVGMGLAFG